MSNFEYREENFKCINVLKSDKKYYEKWRDIRNAYHDELDNGAAFRGIAFTPHGYENHCFGLYRILDWLIPEVDYMDTLNVENIFILDVAVILHDYVMSKNIGKRAIHAIEFKNLIFNTINSDLKVVLEKFLTPSEMNCVADVIAGHSNVKITDKEGNIKSISIIESIDEIRQGNLGSIYLKVLAGLLRLADELDINSNRIQGFDYKNQEFPHDPKATIDSKECWRQCEILLFASGALNGNKTVIALEPDDNKILKCRTKEQIDSDVMSLIGMRIKIQQELINLNDKIFNSSPLKGWKFIKIDFKITNDQLKDLLDPLSNGSNEKKK